MTTAAPLPTPAHQLRDSTLSTPQAQDTTAEGIPIPRGPTTASLSFYSPPADGSRPYNYVEKQPEGVPQRNFGEAWKDVTITDLRGHEDSFTLDNNAFEVLSHIPSQTNYSTFDSDDEVRQVYYPEVEKLILDTVPGANRVLLFDHTIRRSRPEANRAPVTRVHIDQTPSSAEARVRYHLPEEADTLLQSRYRIINVWRPLNGPVLAHPLAVADSATVRDEDLIGVEHRYPDRTGETASVQYHESQKWYYWSGMRNDERLLLKCYDSDERVGPWGRVPHTAFVDPKTPEGANGRESIEVRALVFG